MACINYSGHINRYGYGWLTRKGKQYLAHRWAWMQAHGPIPPGKVVRHKCDNRACINLGHLELGTQKENIQDALDRGRFPIGTDRAPAKLDAEQLAFVRAVYKPRHPEFGGAALARLLGVNQATLSRAISGVTYKEAA